MKCHELDVIVESTSAHHLIAKVEDMKEALAAMETEFTSLKI